MTRRVQFSALLVDHYLAISREIARKVAMAWAQDKQRIQQPKYHIPIS
ncbi:DDB1- and CUL4-associated factor 13 (WD repeat and SOF domain-containing protein 1) [Psidium guajava]|nr:DDB1- and CUL4-associated factor 13 (WD repeat and SOF domain-containing protein 1) [Psidium guajava]